MRWRSIRGLVRESASEKNAAKKNIKSFLEDSNCLNSIKWWFSVWFAHFFFLFISTFFAAQNHNYLLLLLSANHLSTWLILRKELLSRSRHIANATESYESVLINQRKANKMRYTKDSQTARSTGEKNVWYAVHTSLVRSLFAHRVCVCCGLTHSAHTSYTTSIGYTSDAMFVYRCIYTPLIPPRIVSGR